MIPGPSAIEILGGRRMVPARTTDQLQAPARERAGERGAGGKERESGGGVGD